MRVSELTNTSKQEILVHLCSGPTIGVPPNGTLRNVEIANINDIRGQVKIKEDLSEIGGSHGSKQRIDEG